MGHCHPSGRCRKALLSTDRSLVGYTTVGMRVHFLSRGRSVETWKSGCILHALAVPRRYAQQAVTGKTREEVSLEVGDMSWGTFKPLLADATVEHLVSLQV